MPEGLGCRHRMWCPLGSASSMCVFQFTQLYSFIFVFIALIFFSLHWCIPISTIVIVSGRQQRDSAMYIRISILPQIPSSVLSFRFPRNIEQGSLCYTVGPSWLFILKYNSVTFKCKDVWTSLAHKSERLIFLGYKHCRW